jgi:hypothetical protein
MDDGLIYTTITAPDSGMLEISKPNLPVFGNFILIPNGTKIKLEIDPGKPLAYDNIDISPLQPPPLADGKESKQKFVKHAETYSRDADYPDSFVVVDPPAKIRGQECTFVWLFPYRYNPKQRILSVYPDLTVRVSFSGKHQGIPRRLKNKQTDETMRRMAINGEVILKDREKQGETGG